MSFHAFSQQALLTGSVKDSSGKGVPYATISVDKDHGVTADESGSFTIALPAGEYAIRISSVGFETSVRHLRVGAGENRTFDVVIKEATGELNPVVISATRSERELGNLPVPVTVVPKTQMRSMGSLRLNDVLAEQTGLSLVSDHGTGVQVQGLNPEYTLILLDGEPLIGRTAGTLELNRIAVGNIRQVEVVKGPSSSLYGSEALAGVINIITERPAGTNVSLSSRYGTNNTLDLSAGANFQRNKLGVYLFTNRYSTDGYDLAPETVDATVSPFTNYTFNTRITIDISDKTKLSISGRYFTEEQKTRTDVSNEDGGTDLIKGFGEVTDWNINPVLTHRLSNKFRTILRFYASSYGNDIAQTYQSDGQLYDKSFFDQRFYRPELQAEYALTTTNIVTVGAGRIWESIEATRYDGTIRQQTTYVYFQDEWKPTDKLNLIIGGRYDHHNAYGSRFSPKLSAQYDIAPRISVRVSGGVGFKAPDFRQLYLNFTNPTEGYTVFGTEEVAAGMARLQSQGQIAEIYVDPATISNVKAESSIAWNAGMKIKPTDKLNININAFRNDITDMIDTRIIAQKTNKQSVYSYVNIHKVFTHGVESEVSYSPVSQLCFSLGYQFLIARDKSVVDQLKRGEVYKRDPKTNITSRVKEEDYGGLFNRSKHMLNAKIFYDNAERGISASMRAIYRGRYGYADMNSSTILDADNEYADGYVTCNVSVSKTFRQWLRVQAGCDNVFDYTSPAYIPVLPGRLIWGSVGITLNRQ